ncbi:BA75_01893T0 [Komagataella pastoris]|uniref:BA75_01893T0 n=1 Tax=Komagataella pastoris TaxID=4922 RepID=A0A1B2JBE5_PICPA|nr:BA75_01893T0 [Komagataella pastoris]
MANDISVLEDSELINLNIFTELLVMDEDEEDFSQGLITTFVEQATAIFQQIEEALANPTKTDQDLVNLGNLGHYLKGSAAALGLSKIQYECEKIQNFGAKTPLDGIGPKSLTGTPEEINESWCQCIQDSLENAKEYFGQTRKVLAQYYGVGI